MIGPAVLAIGDTVNADDDELSSVGDQGQSLANKGVIHRAPQRTLPLTENGNAGPCGKFTKPGIKRLHGVEEFEVLGACHVGVPDQGQDFMALAIQQATLALNAGACVDG